MKDKDIMNPDIYEIKTSKWVITSIDSASKDKIITFKLPSYRLSTWSEESYLIVEITNGKVDVRIDWNSGDHVFDIHKVFFCFDSSLPDVLECKKSPDAKCSIITDTSCLLKGILSSKILIARSSLEKSKTTRLFNVSEFKEISKEYLGFLN